MKRNKLELSFQPTYKRLSLELCYDIIYRDKWMQEVGNFYLNMTWRIYTYVSDVTYVLLRTYPVLRTDVCVRVQCYELTYTYVPNVTHIRTHCYAYTYYVRTHCYAHTYMYVPNVTYIRTTYVSNVTYIPTYPMLRTYVYVRTQLRKRSESVKHTTVFQTYIHDTSTSLRFTWVQSIQTANTTSCNINRLSQDYTHNQWATSTKR